MLCKWMTGARDRNLECQVLWLQCEMKVGHPGAEFFNSTESAPTSILTMTSPTGGQAATEPEMSALIFCFYAALARQRSPDPRVHWALRETSV